MMGPSRRSNVSIRPTSTKSLARPGSASRLSSVTSVLKRSSGSSKSSPRGSFNDCVVKADKETYGTANHDALPLATPQNELSKWKAHKETYSSNSSNSTNSTSSTTTPQNELQTKDLLINDELIYSPHHRNHSNHRHQPLHLLYGSESPVSPHHVLSQLVFCRKHRLPIRQVSFLGCCFETDGQGVGGQDWQGVGGQDGGGVGEVFHAMNETFHGKEVKSPKKGNGGKVGKRRLSLSSKQMNRIPHLPFQQAKLSKELKPVKSVKSSKEQTKSKQTKWSKSLKELTISHLNPPLSNRDLFHLAPFLNRYSALKKLDLSGGSFDGEAVKCLTFPTFTTRHTCHTHSTRHTCLTSEGKEGNEGKDEWSENKKDDTEEYGFFQRSDSLEVLNLSDNPCLGDEGAAHVVGALKASTRELSRETSESREMPREPEGGKENKKGEEMNSRRKRKFKILSLNNCGVGSLGATSIADFMNHCNSLLVLELSHNPLGDAGVLQLAAALHRSECRLQHLGLNRTDVGDEGAQCLADSLHPLHSNRCSNRSLRVLTLESNAKITDVGALALLNVVFNTASIEAVIGSNHSLQTLSFKGCSAISPSLHQVLKEVNDLLLPSNTHLYKKYEQYKQSKQYGQNDQRVPREEEIIRSKMSKYIESNIHHGVAFDFLEFELLPHLLSFVGRRKLVVDAVGAVGVASVVGKDGGGGSVESVQGPESVESVERGRRLNTLFQMLKGWNLPLLNVTSRDPVPCDDFKRSVKYDYSDCIDGADDAHEADDAHDADHEEHNDYNHYHSYSYAESESQHSFDEFFHPQTEESPRRRKGRNHHDIFAMFVPRTFNWNLCHGGDGRTSRIRNGLRNVRESILSKKCNVNKFDSVQSTTPSLFSGVLCGEFCRSSLREVFEAFVDVVVAIRSFGRRDENPHCFRKQMRDRTNNGLFYNFNFSGMT